MKGVWVKPSTCGATVIVEGDRHDSQHSTVACMPHHAALICKDTLHGCHVATCCKPKNVLHVLHNFSDDGSPTVNVKAPYTVRKIACSGWLTVRTSLELGQHTATLPRPRVPRQSWRSWHDSGKAGDCVQGRTCLKTRPPLVPPDPTAPAAAVSPRTGAT